jgi:hypothetical protein
MRGESDFVNKYNELTFISVTFIEGGLYDQLLLVLGCPLSSPIGGDGRLACDIISVRHTKLLLKVEITWVQDLESSPRCSRILPTNTLIVRCRRKVAQTKIITALIL